MRAGQRPGGHGFGAPETPRAPRPDTVWGRVSGTVLAYIALTKPRVIELLLVATIPAMLFADRGEVDLVLILSTLFGGWMGAASANALNCVVDADIDKVMKRTALRPLARQAVPTRHAFVFGMVLGVVSFLWLWWRANLLAGLLVVATIAFYVLVYTMVLKRRTWQNVVWGGAAGCMPVMVGWAAVTGSLSWEPIVLFLVIFFWTPPHTWALAMRYKEDYKAAGVPMLPVIASEQHVTKQILLYTWATVLATLVLVPAAGLVYAVVTVAAGAWFLLVAHQLYRSVRGGAAVKPLKLFLQSNNYLALVCLGLAVDSVLDLRTVASFF
ncbi:Protoheme IX farnesyltransferase [Rhodococcus rhodochrous ATCC 21198]|uniref:heme o synthase n=1 Tax=Rhodococcus TaxID=1827 RepID=UPI0002D23536|nr:MULTISPECIES: heme o synthase [Rhodococcus]ETT25032.1 Protoheme IX farnesyltransferase [Rhodococcus rhodochrous ATCC 21198]KDE13520.1 protoheme IX farnesyltransferase [Rhodococcus aetherivorans]MDV6292008.1 heme o synthase [Rhodococcus aetherivorans]NGP24476.1 protoheme IX farnesyltransferase [Rhodococcus aetherivorans]PND53888.1 protoheme IX farnesyltransferase [Rhodococcus sp. ENV425]